MTTDTVTLPRRARVEPDDHGHRDDTPALPRRQSPQAKDLRARRPRLSKPGATGWLRLLLSDDNRRPARDHLLLLGPTGGPVWTSRPQ